MRTGNPLWDRFERNAHRTFEEAASRYIQEFDGKDKRRQRCALESLIPYIGNLTLIEVDNSALEGFKEDRKEGSGAFVRPAMAGTINKELTTVVTVLNRACRDWRWTPSVPRIRHVKGAHRVAYPLTWEEQGRLFWALPDNWSMGAALFAVNTGVRRAELFDLQWNDMAPIPELNTFVFTLGGFDENGFPKTKNGMDRAVICNSIARRAVDYQRDNGSKFVFPSKARNNKGGKVRCTNRIWHDAWEKAGLPKDPLIRKGIHNLRHTFAHRLRAANVPEEDRNALLGHSNASLSQHYALPDLERLAEMAERVTERKDTIVLRSIRTVA